MSAAGVTYTYDGDGKRVQKSSSKLYWYGMGSDPLDETDATGSIANTAFKEYIFFGGKRIASRDYLNNVNYYFADHLGSARIVANSSGTPVDDSDFYPFGGERVYLNSSPQNYKFTGKERDSESGLDNFGARYDSSSMGRFMTPDPIFISPARLTDPQGLNLYAYVRNNPLSLTDPTGLDSYLSCTHTNDNASTCQQVDNGSEKIWVQGQTVDGKFQAYDIDMNRDGSGLYSDQFGHDYAGTFDQNGLSFKSVDEGGPSGSGRFINGSDETDVNGSGIFSGLQGKFVSDCGGSCQARGSLYELEPGSGALGRAEAALQSQGKSWSWLDRLSGAHAEGRQWMDANGRIHVIENINGINAGKTELHFEGHPNTGVTERSLHLVNAIRDLASGRAKEQKNLKLP
jgi:RHS repeat-associated protein